MLREGVFRSAAVCAAKEKPDAHQGIRLENGDEIPYLRRVITT